MVSNSTVIAAHVLLPLPGALLPKCIRRVPFCTEDHSRANAAEGPCDSLAFSNQMTSKRGNCITACTAGAEGRPGLVKGAPQPFE